jgi:hypothetical protein
VQIARHHAGMVLKVRDGVPIVWRSPSSMQFGVDEPLVVLDELGEGVERLVAALVSGISRSGLDMMARSVGITAEGASDLVGRLAPVLDGGATTAVSRVVVSGSGPLADEARRLLDTEGVLAPSDESAPDLAVIVAGWLVGAEDHGRWLRRDIPHVPVVVGDAGVTVGPFVEPGSGPCLYCVQLTKTEADPAWPAIATQLWSRRSPDLGRLAIAEAAAFVARRVLERLAQGPAAAQSWRLGPNGAVSSRALARHAACRCAAPEGSDWAPAAEPAIPSATRRAAVDAVPA